MSFSIILDLIFICILTLAGMYHRRRPMVYRGHRQRISSNYGYLKKIFAKSKAKYNKSEFEDYDYPPLDIYYIDQMKYARRNNINDHFEIYKALRRDITKTLEDQIRETISFKRNTVAEINCKSGLGKSLVAVYLYYLHNKLYKEIRGIDFDIDLKYSTDFASSKNRIMEMGNFGFCLQDENNILAGTGKRSFQDSFQNLLNSFRYQEKNYVMSTPDFVYLPNLHFCLIPMGFKKNLPPEAWITRVLIRYIDYYRKTTKPIFLGYALLKVGDIMEYIPKYEQIKDLAYQELEDAGGFRSGTIKKEQRERDIKKLYDYAKENEYDGKSKSELIEYATYELNMGSDINYLKYIANKVYKRFKKEKRKEEKGDEQQNFLKAELDLDLTQEVFDLPHESIMENIDISKLNWENSERDFEIYKDILDPRKKYDIIAREHKLSVGQISNIKKKVVGLFSKIRGDQYEIYFANHLSLHPNYQNWEIIRDGKKSNPDVYAISPDKKRLHIFSCKCYEIERNSTSLNVFTREENGKKIKGECDPEIHFARNNFTTSIFEEIKVFAIIYDHLSKKKHKRDINFLKPQKSIVIRK